MALPPGAGDVGAALVTNTIADKVVFGDKQAQANAILGGGEEKASDGGEGTVVNQKDFYWDQIVLVLISAILGLSFLDISIEFFRGSEVQCFFEIDNFTISKGNYINSFCYGSLPNTQYYLVFILISALVVIAPHYLWNAYYAANFDFFFDLIKKLDRLRDACTGEYSSLNFERVKKLEEKFSKPRIFRFYVLKLSLQLFISVVTLVVNAIYFRKEDFQEEFNCPKNCVTNGRGTQSIPNCSDLWPLNNQFKCVYNSLRLLDFLHSTVFGLLGLTIVILSIGLFWILGRHATELGAKRVADFCFNSCLHPEAFSFTSWKVLLTKCGGRKLKSAQSRTASKNCCKGLWKAIKAQLQPYFDPRIENDLDFLLMRLFKADSGHGQVFRDIQIARHLRMKTSVDHQRLYLLNKIHGDWLDQQISSHQAARKSGPPVRGLKRQNTTHPDANWRRMRDIKKHFYTSGFSAEGRNPELQVYNFFQSQLGTRWRTKPSIRDVIYGFLHFAPNNSLAMDISFGTSTSYSLVLARAFYDVATVHFNRFYKNAKQICRVDRFQANFQTITFHDDIFSQTAEAITNSEKPINNIFSHKDDGGLDLILIGPLSNGSMIDTTNLLIEKMYFKKYFTKDAILVAIRPLWIGSHNRVAHYRQFKPPQGLFRDITKTKVEGELAEAGIDLYLVKPGGKPRIDRAHIAALLAHQSLREESVDIGNEEAEAVEEEGEDEEDGDEDEEYVTLPAKGVLVECNDVECIFEFRLFRYVGSRVAPSDSDMEQSPPPEPDNDAGYTEIPATEDPPTSLSRAPSTRSQKSQHVSFDREILLLNGSVPVIDRPVTEDPPTSLSRPPLTRSQRSQHVSFDREISPPNGSVPALDRTTSLPNDSVLPLDNSIDPAMRSSYPMLDQLVNNQPSVTHPVSFDDNRNAPMSPLQNSHSEGRSQSSQHVSFDGDISLPNGSVPALDRTTSLPNDSVLVPDNSIDPAIRSSYLMLDQLVNNQPAVAQLVSFDDSQNAPMSPPLQNAHSEGTLAERRDEVSSLPSVQVSIQRQQLLRRQTSSLESGDLSRQDSSAPLLPDCRN